MIYTFAGFELDLAAFELRADGKAVSLQPQVFALIALLVENSERFVSKDELVLALMEEHAADRIAAALAGFTGAGDTRHALTDLAAALVHGMRADAAWHRLLAEYFALTAHDPARRVMDGDTRDEGPRGRVSQRRRGEGRVRHRHPERPPADRLVD